MIEAPRVESDTQGVAGAPDIAATIFAKIDRSDIFVADVSIIGTLAADRPSPNPNVLIELGYAKRALGLDRVILVCNTHFGAVDDMPFDIRGKRAMTYVSAPDDESRAEARANLRGQLAGAIRTALDAAAPASVGVRVEVNRGYLLEKRERAVRVEVINDGDRSVFLSGISFEVEGGGGLWFRTDEMGSFNAEKEIRPGDAQIANLSEAKLLAAADGREILAAIATDKTGRKYRGKMPKFAGGEDAPPDPTRQP